MNNEHFKTFARDNVELVTRPIRRVTRRGITAGGGKSGRIDVPVLVTGYNTFELIGSNGVDIGPEKPERNAFRAGRTRELPPIRHTRGFSTAC